MNNFWDEYDHKDPKLTYIAESFRTADVEASITHEFLGCDCYTECTLLTCACLARSGAHYSYADKSQRESYILSITNPNKPVYECNENCKCKSGKCGNRLVSFGPRSELKIITTPKGLGLITEKEIEKGNFVCEYAGEIITSAEAQKRFKKYSEMKLEHNYIFCINEEFGGRREKTFVDPTFYGNVGRYINHSCVPNCILLPVRIQDEVPRLCIFAKEKIPETSELTFDYGESNVNSDNSNRKKCLCMTYNCRKYLPFDDTI